MSTISEISVSASTRNAVPGSPRFNREPRRYEIDADHWIVELDSLAQFESYAHDWDDLVANVARTNVFLERWMLAAAWEQFAAVDTAKEKRSVVLVYRRGKASQFPPVLLGLFPTTVRRPQHVPGRTAVATWRHHYCFDGTPLLRRGMTTAAVSVFMAWAARTSGRPDLVVFEDIDADGAFAAALGEYRIASQLPSFEFTTENRAALVRSDCADSYIDTFISPSTRRELRRQSRRLEEIGEVEYEHTSSLDDVEDWVRDFVALEVAGWKKETALGSSLDDAKFFAKMATAAASHGLFEGLSLKLDGRPIAMKCNLFATEPDNGTSRSAIAFKIAYDEHFARFSPGVLLELENIRRFHAHRNAAWMDSCAAFGHPMIDRLWGDRTRRYSVAFSTGSLRSRATVALCHVVRAARRVWRGRPCPVVQKNF